MQLKTFMSVYKDRVEELFPSVINSSEMPRKLKESMLYSLEAGGKRVRPLLVYAVLDTYGISAEKADKTACAIEFIHTYSLIHDDLPAMDDDDIRRGRPTNHRVYGEACAVLAGDALLTQSFQLIAGDKLLSADKKVDIIAAVSEASGAPGMVGGQLDDMEAEGREVDVEELEYIHARKTGALLSVALQAGAVIAGAPEEEQRALEAFGKHIGLSFQIKDDLLDVEGEESEIGKPVGSDESNDKNTYVRLLGADGAREKLDYHTSMALAELERVSGNTEVLKELTAYISERTK
ncbi:polyprenyl synthetase family protein [Alkalicoccus luteus]|uniref:polyprenyl synthetase family protein n=1 Tax=Alkalicoccus luteus TaxID=1237094 RepID=UPI0031B5FF50